MTGARQMDHVVSCRFVRWEPWRCYVSLTHSSLFAHCGYCRMHMTKTAYERELDRLLDASEDEPPAAR